MYDLNENTFYIISKGQVHNFLYAKDLEGTLIRFKEVVLPSVRSQREGYYHNLLFDVSRHDEIAVQTLDVPFVEMLLARMEHEIETPVFKKQDLSLIQHLLFPILILIDRYAPQKTKIEDYRQDRYTQFITVLESDFIKHHDLAYYAQSIGLSNRRLSEICIAKTGKSAKKIIKERLVTEAKRLIRYTSLPQKEIVDRLGFKDVGYFCRFFKKSVDMTPTEYKNSK